MTRYAEKTTVSSERTRNEIEQTLRRYGADQFMYGWEDGQALIAFRAHERHIRFGLPLPDRHAAEFTHVAISNQYGPTGKFVERKAADAERVWEQACRQRWRALALVIKAKLEAVAAGITEFETEFLPHIVLPDDRTVAEWMRPQVDQAYRSGLMPKLLPMLPATGEGSR